MHLEGPRGKRMKNIFQSVPFCLTPRPLAFLPSFSFLSLSLSWLSRERNRVEIYPSCPRKKRPTSLESPFSFSSWKAPSMAWTKSDEGVSRANFFWSKRFGPAFEFVCSRGIILYVRTFRVFFYIFLVVWYFILSLLCHCDLSQWRGIRFFFFFLSFNYIKDEDACREFIMKIFTVCCELHERLISYIKSKIAIVYKVSFENESRDSSLFILKIFK